MARAPRTARPGPRAAGPGEGLDADSWAANEFAGAALGDARLSARLVERAHHMAQSPMRAITGATHGARALVKGHYRLIDQPADSEVSVEHILAPHRGRTLQRMGSEDTVLCVQDTTSLSFTRRGQTQGLGVIGSNQTGALARGLHLHTTLAVNPDGVPLGVLRAGFDAPAPAQRDETGKPTQTTKPREERKSFRWVGAARLRAGGPAPAPDPCGVHHGPRGRLPRPVHRATRARPARRAAGACEGRPRPRQGRHARGGTRSRGACSTRCATPRPAAPAPSNSIG